MIFKLAAFLVDEFLLVLIQTLIADHADHAHMAVDRITNLGDQGRCVFSAALEIACLRFSLRVLPDLNERRLSTKAKGTADKNIGIRHLSQHTPQNL